MATGSGTGTAATVGGTTTRLDLLGRIARRYKAYLAGTATSGSTTTVIDTTNLSEPDNYWNNHWCYITSADSADPEGEERLITAYTQSTSTLTTDAFSAAVATSDTYEILPCKRGDIEAAIDTAVRRAGSSWKVYCVDTSTVDIGSDDYDYSLPSDLVNLVRVRVRGGTDEAWEMLPREDWYVTGTPGAQYLQLISARSVSTSDTVALDYVKRLTELTADSSVLGIGAPYEDEVCEFIVNHVLYDLHHTAATRGGDMARYHFTAAQNYREVADEIRLEAGSAINSAVKPESWSRSLG